MKFPKMKPLVPEVIDAEKSKPPTDVEQFYRQGYLLFFRMSKFLGKMEKYVIEVKKEHAETKALLKDVKKTNALVEQTICNVLLAIRQNEYLQAYYPESAPKHKKSA